MVLHWSWMDASSHCPNSSRNLITKNKYPPWTPLGLLRNANGPSLNCQILHTKGMPDYSKALNTHWGNNSLEVCFFFKTFFFFFNSNWVLCEIRVKPTHWVFSIFQSLETICSYKPNPMDNNKQCCFIQTAEGQMHKHRISEYPLGFSGTLCQQPPASVCLRDDEVTWRQWYSRRK